MRLLHRALMLASILPSLIGPAWAADPDFSGVWKFNEQASVLRALPVQPDRELWLEHKGASIRWGKPPAVRLLMTDGKETRNRFGDVEERSILKWEGTALLINTIVRLPKSNYTQMDRWKLSRDGKTLTIRRQIVSLHGEMESTLVYEKQ